VRSGIEEVVLKKPELLEILACPLCKSGLRQDEAAARLICFGCQHEYPVENGIPIMLNDSSVLQQSIEASEQFLPSPPGFLRRLQSSKVMRALWPPPAYLGLNYRRINKLIHNMGPGAKILEVGAGSERRLKNTINLDIEPTSNVDVVGDAHQLPFKTDSLDCVLCISVLEHLKQPRQCVAEVHRVLREGGCVHADTPFLLGFHGVPTDYTRWTLQGMEELFSQFHKIESGVANGPSAAVYEILRSYVSLFSDNPYFCRILSFVTGWLLFPLRYLDFILIRKKCPMKLSLDFPCRK